MTAIGFVLGLAGYFINSASDKHSEREFGLMVSAAGALLFATGVTIKLWEAMP